MPTMIVYLLFKVLSINCVKYACNLIPSRHYINYKLMKKKVNRYAQQIEVGAQNRLYVLMDFAKLLDSQVIMTVLEKIYETINIYLSNAK